MAVLFRKGHEIASSLMLLAMTLRGWYYVIASVGEAISMSIESKTSFNMIRDLPQSFECLQKIMILDKPFSR